MRIVANNFPVYQLNERTTIYVAAADSFTHGDSQKWEKELFYLKRIFGKRELKGKLPIFSKWRLLSMCYFHLAVKNQKERKVFEMYGNAFRSFFLYPKGYNGKTNFQLLVMMIYEFPFIGKFIRFIKKNRNGYSKTILQ
jgi:hypothetical protein